MSLKSHVIVAVTALQVVQYVGKKVMDSDSQIAREAQRKTFAAIPHDRLLRYEQLVEAELNRRRTRPMGPTTGGG